MSIIVWIVSALIFLGMINLLSGMPNGRQLRAIAGTLAVVGLGVSALVPVLRWHLIWFTPLALAAAYTYALRHLFTLASRMKKLKTRSFPCPEEARRAIEEEVGNFNRKMPEDMQMK